MSGSVIACTYAHNIVSVSNASRSFHSSSTQRGGVRASASLSSSSTAAAAARVPVLTTAVSRVSRRLGCRIIAPRLPRHAVHTLQRLRHRGSGSVSADASTGGENDEDGWEWRPRRDGFEGGERETKRGSTAYRSASPPPREPQGERPRGRGDRGWGSHSSSTTAEERERERERERRAGGAEGRGDRRDDPGGRDDRGGRGGGRRTFGQRRTVGGSEMGRSAYDDGGGGGGGVEGGARRGRGRGGRARGRRGEVRDARWGAREGDLLRRGDDGARAPAPGGGRELELERERGREPAFERWAERGQPAAGEEGEGEGEGADASPDGARRRERSGREGAWQYASEGQARAWRRATATPLAPGETFRVVDVGGGARSNDKNKTRATAENRRKDDPYERTLSAGRGSPSDEWSSDGDGDGDGYGGGVRVNKCFKDFTSRREADRMVRDGRVAINGVVASMGARVSPGDVVTLDGREVRWETLAIIEDDADLGGGGGGGGIEGRSYGHTVRGGGADEARGTASDDARRPRRQQFRYVKYWKPRGVVCTTDRRDRNNIIDAVGYPERVFPVGRLDKDSTGLILLTSDGRLPNAVLRSGHRHDKKYVVEVDRDVSLEDVQTLREGVVISTPVQRDRVSRVVTARTLPCRVEKVGRRALEIVLQEGRNRQIRRMLDHVGYQVTALHRVEVMGLDLSGVRRGEWKECTPAEVDVIRKCIRAQAGRGDESEGGGDVEEEDDWE